MPQYRSKLRTAPIPPITQDDVFFLLEPLVGLPLLLKHSELSSEIAAMLSDYDWRNMASLDELFHKVESALFNHVFSYTNGKMVVKDAEGHNKKIYTDALNQMAEALMEPLFLRLPVSDRALELFSDYALRHLSLPAVKRLYTDYLDQLLPENRAIFARIVTENFPKEAYQGWLVE